MLVRLEGVVARVRAAQAGLIAEADRLRLPFQDGARSLVDWTAGRLDVSRETALDLVRLAKSDHVDGVGSGEVSFDRAVLRRRLIATDATKEALDISDRLDLAAMRRFVASHRRFRRADGHAAHEERRLVFEESTDANTTRFWGRLAGVDGAIVRQAIAALADTIPQDTASTRAQRNADALGRC